MVLNSLRLYSNKNHSEYRFFKNYIKSSQLSNGLKTKMGATQQCMGEFTPLERQGSVAEAICASMYEPTVDSSQPLPTSYDRSLPLCLPQASCSVDSFTIANCRPESRFK